MELGIFGMRPLCPICLKQIREGDCKGIAMHEVLFTQGDIQNLTEEDKLMYFVPANVVLVHNQGCHQIAATKEGQEMCVKQILNYVKKEDLLLWLEMVKHLSKTTTYREAVNLIERLS